jgi:hypothetical protein
MMISLVERSPQRYARIAGMLYLAIIVLGMFGEMFVRGSLVAVGDPAATANNIAASPFLWRAGIAGDLLMHVLDVPQIVIFYFLLRPVDESLALLAAFFNLIQTAVLALNKLNLLVPLFLLEDATHPGAFPAQELQAISHWAIKAHGHGFAIGLVFFGFACLVLGYLIFKSGYFPRTLGVLLQIAGVSYLINSFALLLAPSFAQSLFPGILVPALVGEVSLCVWLIAKGVNVQRWEQRVKH